MLEAVACDESMNEAQVLRLRRAAPGSWIE